MNRFRLFTIPVKEMLKAEIIIQVVHGLNVKSTSFSRQKKGETSNTTIGESNDYDDVRTVPCPVIIKSFGEFSLPDSTARHEDLWRA